MTKPSDGSVAWEWLLRAHAALVPALSDDVERQTGVPLSWYDVLLELSRAPSAGVRMAVLGDRVVLSRSRVSRVVDAMVAAGLVRKDPDPADGRATLAVLTPAGRKMFRTAAPAYLAAIDRHFSIHLRPPEIEGITRGLRRVLDATGRPGAADDPDPGRAPGPSAREP